MNKLSTGEQFTCRFSFNHGTLVFLGKAGGEDVYLHPDSGNDSLLVNRCGMWLDTGHTSITELRVERITELYGDPDSGRPVLRVIEPVGISAT